MVGDAAWPPGAATGSAVELTCKQLAREESKMKRCQPAWAVLAIVIAWSSVGCGQPSLDETSTDTTIAIPVQPAVIIKLCGDCGQVKGTDSCCADGSIACTQCGLQKGAVGCCKMEKGVDVTLCSHCGHVAGSDTCCAPGEAKCGDCGMSKGAVGCCLQTADLSATSLDDDEGEGDDDGDEAAVNLDDDEGEGDDDGDESARQPGAAVSFDEHEDDEGEGDDDGDEAARRPGAAVGLDEHEDDEGEGDDDGDEAA